MNIVQKIISLVPSQTELLFDLGLDEEVVGITKFCVHPQHWFKTKTRIGGTKNINIKKIKALQPDLVIANKEENVKEQVEALQNFTQVYVSDIKCLNDALNMILDVGKLVNRQLQAEKIVGEIKTRFAALKEIANPKIAAAYLIWQQPYMTVGGDTFINDMMQHCGFKNVFENESRYPGFDIEELKHDCKMILLSSEPFPFKQKHADALQQLLPDTKIVLVDGEIFSWYGSRLLLAPDYFKNLIQSISINY